MLSRKQRSLGTKKMILNNKKKRFSGIKKIFLYKGKLIAINMHLQVLKTFSWWGGDDRKKKEP